MRTLLQRVTQASVSVAGEDIARIGPGLLILVCAMEGDCEVDASASAAKASKLRIFPDDDGRMNKSVLDTAGAVLVVSQFTLAADTRRGNRPGFSTAAHPARGKELFEHYVDCLQSQIADVQTGEFGADMKVSLINDGPVTIWLES